MRFRVRLTTTIVLLPIILILISNGVTLITLGITWSTETLFLWSEISQVYLEKATLAVDSNIHAARLAARAIQKTDPYMLGTILPNSTQNGGYDLTPLTRLFNSLDKEEGEDRGWYFNSLGYYMRKSPDDLGKLSWQITQGFDYGCPELTFFFCDQSIWPDFKGYCASRKGVIDWSKSVYNGSDWGLDTSSQKLLNGTITQLFNPIWLLEGHFMVSYFETYIPGGQVYVTYAEVAIDEFSNQIKDLTIADGEGIVYVAEIDTKGLIATNLPVVKNGIVITPDGRRILANESKADAISLTIDPILAAIKDSGDDQTASIDVLDWHVEAVVYDTLLTDNQKGTWLIVAVIPDTTLYGRIKLSFTAVTVACALFVFSMIVIWAVVAYFSVHLRLKHQKEKFQKKEEAEGLLSQGFPLFEDLEDITQDIEEMSNMDKKKKETIDEDA